MLQSYGRGRPATRRAALNSAINAPSHPTPENNGFTEQYDALAWFVSERLRVFDPFPMGFCRWCWMQYDTWTDLTIHKHQGRGMCARCYQGFYNLNVRLLDAFPNNRHGTGIGRPAVRTARGR